MGARVEGRRGQGRSPRLRAVEGVEARRAELGIAVGFGATRLAHRMLGNVDVVPGAPLRHTRRRDGLAVSASRERDCPERGGHRQQVRERLDAQRFRAHRRREDVEVAWQFLHAARSVLEHYPAEAVRCFMLSQPLPAAPLNYSEDHLRQADASVRRLYTALRGLDGTQDVPDAEWCRALFVQRWTTTSTPPEAISVLFDLAPRDQPSPRTRPATRPARDRSCRHVAPIWVGCSAFWVPNPEAWLRGSPTGEEDG